MPEIIDHLNRIRHDNRIENLRECTEHESHWNRNVMKTNSSGFKGVDWMSSKKKYRAAICYEGKRLFLGLFADPIDAARAYDVEALRLHGDFAVTNFSQMPDPPIAA